MWLETIFRELQFKAVRSSGPGGQHVNKTSSKMEVAFNIAQSQGLTEHEKNLLLSRLGSRISNAGVLVLQCGESRSQHRNKNIVISRLISLLQENLKVVPPRRKTKPSRGVIQKRLDSKKKQALKKANRKPPKF